MNRSVLVLEDLDDLNSGGAGQSLLVIFAELGRRFGRKNLIVRMAEQSSPRHAECSHGGIIDEDISAIQVLDPRQPRQMQHESREALLRGPQFFFSSPPIEK